MPTQIQLSTLQEWNDRLNSIYSTHDLSYTYVVFDTVHPLSSDIKELYDKFQSAYQEAHLAKATKWTIADGELDVGSLMLYQTITDVNTSLTSMDAQAHYNRTVNTAGTTYSRTYHGGYGTTWVRTTNSSAGTTYTRTTHSLLTTNSITSNSAVASNSRTSNKAAQSCSSQTNDGRSGYSSKFGGRVINTNRTTYTQTANTIGTSYTRTQHSAGTYYGETSNSAASSYSQTIYSGDHTGNSRTAHTNAITYTES